jgi:hypothetical protein
MLLIQIVSVQTVRKIGMLHLRQIGNTKRHGIVQQDFCTVLSFFLLFSFYGHYQLSYFQRDAFFMLENHDIRQ